MYVQGRGTLFDVLKGRVVGEGDDGEEENASTITDEVIVKKEVKKEVAVEVENREEGREEKEEDEGTLYLLVDSLLLLEELAMPSSLPYIPSIPPPPSSSSSTLSPPPPSSPSLSPSLTPTSLLSPSRDTGASVSSPDILLTSDVGNDIGSDVGMTGDSEGRDISSSVAMYTNTLSTVTSLPQIHSIPITDSVTVTLDTVGTVTVTVISRNGRSNGNGSGTSDIQSSVNDEKDNMKNDKEGNEVGKSKGEEKEKEKETNKIITLTIPSNKENENFITQISSITISESYTDKSDELTGNTAKLDSVLIASGKKSSKKRKKERIEGVDYMEIGLPRNKVTLVNDIISLENMIVEMQEEIFDTIDNEIENEEEIRNNMNNVLNNVQKNQKIIDKNNKNEKNEKSEKKEKKEIKVKSADVLSDTSGSSLAATLRVVGFDCEWRPEHYFERKIVHSNNDKNDQIKAIMTSDDKSNRLNIDRIDSENNGRKMSYNAGMDDKNDLSEIYNRNDNNDKKINKNNNINDYNDNSLNNNSNLAQNEINKKIFKNDDNMNGKRKLISPLGKKNRGSRKINNMINDIDNEFQDVLLMSENNEFTAKHDEKDKIEKNVRERSDLRKLAAEKDYLISHQEESMYDSPALREENNDINEVSDTDKNQNERENKNGSKNENENENENEVEILRSHNISWGRFDAPRAQRRKEQTSRGPSPARMASPVMLLQVD